MGNAKDNEDESAHASGTDEAMEHASSLHPVPADQDAPVPPENDDPASHFDVSSNDRNNAELNSTLPQSDFKAPSPNNREESKSSPQMSQTGEAICDNKETNPPQSQIEAAPDSNGAELKTNIQTAQTETILNDNIEGLTVDSNTDLIQPLNKAISGNENVDLKASPETKAAVSGKDVDSISSPEKPPTGAAPIGDNVELESGPKQPLQGSCLHAPSDENKSLLKLETEPPTDEKTKGNENAYCKLETCGVDCTSKPNSSTEIAELATTSKAEPFELLEDESDHQAGAVSEESKEPATPHAESASIKAELEEKRDLKDGNNDMNIMPNNNSNSNSNNSFLLENYDDGSESGSEEEQRAFMKELENFFRERRMEFKPPKFYGEGLNCLKLWRSVMRLGGYDKVTSCKLWRQVGESFKPPKTCTTVSWTFRGFYEKALLDYERHKTCGSELSLPPTTSSEPMSVDNQTPGLGRARREAAARAMQGWHSRLLGNAEVNDAVIKDKNSLPLQKHEKQLKNVGMLKRKKPSYMEHVVKAARAKLSKPQVDVEVVDLGPPADWVKINVQETKDCFEVYALVPGLLREEVRVQSDPAGRLVISGEPENPDNPWGVTPFKKAVSLPSRIDPHQTSAVVTLHGQLFVRVPFEQSD